MKIKSATDCRTFLVSPQWAILDGIYLVEIILPGIRFLIIIPHDADAIEASARISIFLEASEHRLRWIGNQEVGNPQHIRIHIMQAVIIQQLEHLLHHLLCRSTTANKWQMSSRGLFFRNRKPQLSQSLRLPLLHQVNSPGAHREVDEEAISLQFLCRFFEQSY